MNSNQFRNNAETATGTVVDFSERSDPDGNPISCPVLRFTTKSGQSVDAVSDVCNDGVFKGDTFQLYYDPNNPETIRVNNSASSIWIPAFFVAFGIFGLAKGSGLFGRKKTAK